MIAALTVRKLKPGTYDEWRKAWWSDDVPEGAEVYVLRNFDDPDEIIAFGMTDRSIDELREEIGEEQQERNEAMAPHIESIGADGLYEVIDEVTN